MEQMHHKFTRSSVVMNKLAIESSRTPPSEGNSFDYVDQCLTILGRTSDVHSERLREEFLSQRYFIANQIKEVDKKLEDAKEEMDGRFNEVDKKLEDAKEEMDGRFNEVDKKMDRRFNEVDKKLEDLEKKMDRRIDGVNNNMRDYLNHMQKASRNFLCARGWCMIYPVGSLDLHGGIQTPDYFPRNVTQFWRLKEPTQIDRLVYLIRFYEIQGYEEWGRDTDSLEGYSDSDDSSEGTSESSRLPMPIPLEEAVRSNPEIAHRALGVHLGLPYDDIQSFMKRARELSQGQVIGSKRGRDDEASGERKKRGRDDQASGERKIPGFNLSEITKVTSPTEPRSSQGRTG